MVVKDHAHLKKPMARGCFTAGDGLLRVLAFCLYARVEV